MLNKSKGNMFEWVTHTWNTVKGKCPHDCVYCYMKVFPQGKLRLDAREFKTDLGRHNTIFVGSSCDMWANDVPDEWIKNTLVHCDKYWNNQYLFQSKNPRRIYEFRDLIQIQSIIGTTIETNRYYQEVMGKCPTIEERVEYLRLLGSYKNGMAFMTEITIEPIMDFDLNLLLKDIRYCKPKWVNIGADSKGHNLPEPDKEKVEALIEELRKFTEVKIKDNLSRIIGNAHFTNQKIGESKEAKR